MGEKKLLYMSEYVQLLNNVFLHLHKTGFVYLSRNSRNFYMIIEIEKSFNLLLILLHHFLVVRHGSDQMWIWTLNTDSINSPRNHAPLHFPTIYSIHTTFSCVRSVFWFDHLSHTISKAYLRIQWSDGET